MSQAKGNAYTFFFATAVCVVCSLILAGASTFLKPTQEANVKLDIAVNILSSVGYEPSELKAKEAQEVFETYDREFKVLLLDGKNNEADRGFMEKELLSLGYPEGEIKDMGTGELLRLFDSKKWLLASKAGKSLGEYDPNYKAVFLHTGKSNQIDAYVVPIQGNGLWNVIKGYLAIEPDLNTVKGISFYEHHETPGLGARITEDWFIDNYKGKKIYNQDGELVSITIVKGRAKDRYEPPKLRHYVDGISGATLTCKGINEFMLADLKKYDSYFKSLKSKQ